MTKSLNSKLVLIPALALTFGLSGTLFAQDTTDPNHPRVDQVNSREVNQENRITQGVQSGQLTSGEAARLNKAEANLQAKEAADEAKHNGHLTAREQANLNKRENNISKRIYKDKHNAATTAPAQ